MDGSGLMLDYKGTEKKALLVPFNDAGEADRSLVKKDGTGASVILFRSLDQPNWMRGLELSWFGVDEGRHLDGGAWEVLYGRLRQKGYQHRGFVCSTPNGFDWMWRNFHPDSKHRLADASWYGAPSMDNARNLPDGYVDSLIATYEGRFLRQEVYGEFVGVVSGAVFFEYDPTKHIRPLKYDPELPLYSFWDFGMGDLGTCIFAQLEWVQKGDTLLPNMHLLDSLDASDRTSAEWARIFNEYSQRKFGKMPELNICDPAGRQRNLSTGKSIIQDFASYGVRMTPAQKRPIDHAISIINNMLAGNRVLIDTDADRLAAAFASHKWSVAEDGTKTGLKPVHDWTSHFCDAVRYGVTLLVGSQSKTVIPDDAREYRPDEYGYIKQQLLKDPRENEMYLGASGEPDIEWEPAMLAPRKRNG